MPAHFIFLLAGLLALPVAAQHGHDGAPSVAPPAWTQHPLLLPAAGRGERDAAQLKAVGIAAATLRVHAPEGPAEALLRDYPVTDGRAKIATGSARIGNYHWVVMREETPAWVKVASTAWYFGNPGASPRALLATPKHELEIVPDPLPREHGSYRESEKWRFLVRFQGIPQPGQKLTLETEFGTRTSFVTDQSGIATVLFPRDFRPPSVDKEEGASHGRPSAKFVLSTEKHSDERHYLTAFNLNYAPDAERGRSLAWGAGFCLAGMLAATPLLRRRPARTAREKTDA